MSYLVVVVGVPGLHVRLVGEVSVRIMVSVNESRSECLLDIDAAESLVIVHGKEVLLKFTRVLESLLTIGMLTVLIALLLIYVIENMWSKRCVRSFVGIEAMEMR